MLDSVCPLVNGLRPKWESGVGLVPTNSVLAKFQCQHSLWELQPKCNSQQLIVCVMGKSLTSDGLRFITLSKKKKKKLYLVCRYHSMVWCTNLYICSSCDLLCCYVLFRTKSLYKNVLVFRILADFALFASVLDRYLPLMEPREVPRGSEPSFPF